MMAMQLWRPVALALLVAAALGYRALLVHQRDAARAASAHLSASLADAEASNTALQNAVATQNSAVAQLRAELEEDQAGWPRRANAPRPPTARQRCAPRPTAPRRSRAHVLRPDARRRVRWGNAQAAELGRW